MTGCKTDFLCTLYCHEDYIWSHWVLCGVHHMTRNNFAKLNSLQSYKGVLVLPWYNFHSCNLILVHPLMLVTWRDCGQLQKHFMREELFYLTMYTVIYQVPKVWTQHHFVPVPRHQVWTVPYQTIHMLNPLTDCRYNDDEEEECENTCNTWISEISQYGVQVTLKVKRN